MAAASCVLPWLSGPPLAGWPIALVAITPLLFAVVAPNVNRKVYGLLYLAGGLYWAVTLQGLRHANPLIYPCWIALAAYLGIYPVLFVAAARRMMRWGMPLPITAPVAWVGVEAIRSYLLTGLSAAMLGHALADVPVLIQIADLGGSYVVSAWLVVINVGLFCLMRWIVSRKRSPRGFPWAAVVASLVVVIASLLYGSWRLGQPTRSSQTTIALIGRSEAVEWNQESTRELELFDAYARQSIDAVGQSDRAVAAVVWPESMFTGTLPWIEGDGSEAYAAQSGLTWSEMRLLLEDRRRDFRGRAASLQSLLAGASDTQSTPPEIIAGCGVVRYGETVRGFSGVVHIGAEGDVQDWYGKNHLVMFGEYIPVVGWIPMLRSLVPANMGLSAGSGPETFDVGRLSLCPNVCIETAVERVPIGHLQQVRKKTGKLPDAIVTVTNDAWFDDSSVVVHHRRCAQFVALACRRPILSAANNGPTVWIDSCGRIVDQVPQGQHGNVFATPDLDDRVSLAILIGDWPAVLCGILVTMVLATALRPRRLRPESA